MQQWDKLERRDGARERRNISDRRMSGERRFDYREANPPVKRSLKCWMRSLFNSRLGVDRRKGTDRRMNNDRRSQQLRSILTSEELSGLLQE